MNRDIWPPPEKKERGLATTLKTAELLRAYQLAPRVQAQWLRHGERLLTLYRKTRRVRYWRAYCVHLTGMAALLESSG